MNDKGKVTVTMDGKFILRSALAAVCLCLLTSCSKETSAPQAQTQEETQTETKQETEKEKDPKRIGICIYNYEDAFMKLYTEELKSELADAHSAYVMISDAGGDPQIQQKQVETYLAQEYDGVIVNLVEPGQAGEIADLCNRAGIPVVFINREPSTEEEDRWKKEKIKASYVGAEAAQAGNYQGELILNLPDHGDRNQDGTVTYGVIKGDGKTTDSYYRAKNPPKILEEAGLKTSGIFLWPGNWKEEEGYEAAATALALYGRNLEVLFCGNDAMAIGAVKAAEEANLIPGKDLYVVGVDALEEAVSLVKSGKLAGTLLNDHSGQAKKAAEVMISLVSGGKADSRYVVDYLKITGISDYPITFK